MSSPALLTCVQDPSPLSFAMLAAHGWEEAYFQAQNGGNDPRDYDLGLPRQQGIRRASVWGVTYDEDDDRNNPRGLSFHEQNEILGRQAARLGAEGAVMVDAEQCAKDTRDTRGMAPCIDGLRAGGWAGPVHLCPLGAPSDPLVNDFKVDVRSFLETGGDVYPQAYMHDHAEYDPVLCIDYWTRPIVGVPRDRLNLMVSFSAGDTSHVRWSGAEWLPRLQAASAGRAISSFMAEFMTDADLRALDPLTLAPPTPAPGLDPRLPTIAANTLIELGLATARFEPWRKANPGEWDKLVAYLGTVADGGEPAPVDLGTHKGRGVSGMLQGSAALLNRLP